MQRLIYQVNIGKPSKLYNFCIKSVREYCNKYKIDHFEQTRAILNVKPDLKTTGRSKECVSREVPLPIFEKENAFNDLRFYNQVAIIDADIYIKPNAPNIFDQIDYGIDFAGVVERDMPIIPKYKNKIIGYSRGQYSTLKDVDWKWNHSGGHFMNMGVMVMNQSILQYIDEDPPAYFIYRPEFKKFVDGVGKWKWSTDQTLLNYWLKKENIKVQELNWKWNSLYNAIYPESIKKAYFVHFFLKDHLPNKGENIKDLLSLI